MSSHWKAVLGVILVFLFGCVSGWLSASLVHYHQTTVFLQRGPEAMAELLERRMTRNLGLDENQKQQIHEYFMENLQQRKELQKEIQPQVQVLNRQTMQQIVAILNPDQAERFHENIAQFRQRFGKGVFNPNAENPSPSNISSANPATNSASGVSAPGQ